jgi:hypothetical protein
MTTRSNGTRQVNLKLTGTQEEIVRLVVQRLRAGGPEFEARVRWFFSEAPTPRYMHVDDLDRRFGEIDRRLARLETEIAADRDSSYAEAEGEDLRQPATRRLTARE